MIVKYLRKHLEIMKTMDNYFLNFLVSRIDRNFSKV